VHILPDVMIAARQTSDPTDLSVFAPLEGRLEVLVDDLMWWTATLAAGRAAS
jgi:hypothetical protein